MIQIEDRFQKWVEQTAIMPARQRKLALDIMAAVLIELTDDGPVELQRRPETSIEGLYRQIRDVCV